MRIARIWLKRDLHGYDAEIEPDWLDLRAGFGAQDQDA